MVVAVVVVVVAVVVVVVVFPFIPNMRAARANGPIVQDVHGKKLLECQVETKRGRKAPQEPLLMLGLVRVCVPKA